MESPEDILTATAVRIRELEQRKHQLLQEASEVDQELHLTRARHRQLLNRSAPISVLPYEILSSIFLLCRDDYLPERIPFELVLSHVSSIWRDICFITANLWDHIFVQLPNSCHHETAFARRLDRVNLYLDRSRSSPFSVRIVVTGGNFVWAEFLDAFAGHMWRCRELSISVGPNFSPIQDVVEKLRFSDVQQLERVSFSFAHHVPHAHEIIQFQSTLPRIFTAGSPNLTFVRLVGVAGPLQPPLENVTTLHIDGSYMAELSLDKFRALIQSAPQLVNLTLAHIMVTPQALTQPLKLPLDLPRLRHLRMSGLDDLEDDCSALLLSQLPLTQITTLFLREVPDIGANCFPNVHSLCLCECAFPSTQLIHTVDAFPSLIHLDCDVCPVTVLLILSWGDTDLTGPEDNVPAIWPKITTLTVRDMGPVHSNLLLKCVQSRRRRNVPLKMLSLDKRSRTSLRNFKDLDELQKMVEVVNVSGFDPWPENLSFEDDDDRFWG